MKPPVVRSRIQVLIEEPRWRLLGRTFPAQLRRAAGASLVEAGRSPGGLTILLGSDARLAALNAQFRDIEKPTNVLSFPAGTDAYLGDVAIAYGVTAREAEDTSKTIREHALHLAVHGVLHLLGYDHETVREARIMEPMEVSILAKLGIADPYLARTASAMAD